MNYLYAFLNELFSIGGSLIGTDSSLFSSITGSASSSSIVGSELMDEEKVTPELLGSTTTCGATSVSLAAISALDKTDVEINVTQTYVESLSREELLTLQELLQEKQIMIENQNEDQISRSLNKNTNI